MGTTSGTRDGHGPLALGAGLAVLTASAVVLVPVAGWGVDEVLEWFVASNLVIGLSFGLCGLVVVRHRPRHPLGRLMAAAGVAHLLSAVAAPLGQVLADAGGPQPLQRATATVFAFAWPWSIALFLPLMLLVYPDGRVPGPRWRWGVVAVVASAPVFAVAALDPTGSVVASAPPWPRVPGYDALAPLWAAGEVRTLAALLLGVTALVVRYRRGQDTEQHQVLWLMLAATLVLGLIVPWSLVSGTSALVLFSIPLIPASVALAVVRHQLLDIRLVLSRVLSWVLLSLAALLAYTVLVGALDRVATARFGRSALVTVLVALAAAPVLPRLQRLVEHRLYGERRDPSRLVSRVGTHLASGAGEGLNGTVSAVATALRLPYVALATGSGIAAVHGDPPAVLGSVPLTYDGAPVGELRVGLRSGERVLAEPDRAALLLLAAPLAVAVHTLELSRQLQASRERIVTAREDERRRLRRDLHDGLGPSLTGIALTAEAATNLVADDPARARELLERLSSRTQVAIGEVRRLVDELRPPALDELGLVGALRRHAEELEWRAGGDRIAVALDIPAALPPLPAAVEVAAYRIATEALTNVVRHAHGAHVWLALSVGDELCLEVTDDGPDTGAWLPGVGLAAMRERAAELGGRFVAGPRVDGGRVRVELPLAAP